MAGGAVSAATVDEWANGRMDEWANGRRSAKVGGGFGEFLEVGMRSIRAINWAWPLPCHPANGPFGCCLHPANMSSAGL